MDGHRFPYDRRFLDRPVARGHAPALAITTPSTARPTRARRRERWAVDDGTRPLGRAEIYALVLGALVLALLTLIALRFIWPDATGGVRPDAG